MGTLRPMYLLYGYMEPLGKATRGTGLPVSQLPSPLERCYGQVRHFAAYPRVFGV